MNTKSKSSIMAASCSSKVSVPRGAGCNAEGAVLASGGTDTRIASGAVVCGCSVATGSHGSDGSSGFGLRGSASAARDRAASLDLHRSPDDAALLVRRSGLLVRLMSLSLVVTVTRSVLRSSVLRLAGLGLPEADLLCAGFVYGSRGDGTLLSLREVALSAAEAGRCDCS